MPTTNHAVLYAFAITTESLVDQIQIGVKCLSDSGFSGCIQIAADLHLRGRTDRPAFEHACQTVNAGCCNVLAAEDSSRLSRDQSELIGIIQSADDHGVRVMFADGDIDSQSAVRE